MVLTTEALHYFKASDSNASNLVFSTAAGDVSVIAGDRVLLPNIVDVELGSNDLSRFEFRIKMEGGGRHDGYQFAAGSELIQTEFVYTLRAEIARHFDPNHPKTRPNPYQGM